MTPFTAVCSAKPRPTVQRGKGFFKTGEAAWGRDPYHIKGEGDRTLCGVDCSEWLTIGELTELTRDCCLRCAAKASILPPGAEG